MPDPESAVAARLASAHRNVVSRALTADNSLRSVLLPGGGWRLYGATGQVYMTTRPANSDGSLATNESAPAGTLGGSTAGTPAATKAYDTSNGSVDGNEPLPLDATQWVEIAVPPSGFVLLYVSAPGGVQHPTLVGPYR